MLCNVVLAVTWLGQDHRLFGLNWSYLTILGFIGNAIFSTRFLIQWIASEKKGKSVIPDSFWYWSIAGSVIMCIYWIMERSPVGIVSYLPNTLIYMRNLHLIKKHTHAVMTSTPNEVSHKQT
ncbi:MAG: lipid-A-disaccharide synthase N-terminal domain-containing protein [Planctomycetia bacterium]|nr:lipid-A-disaccharide synthase N-terminal domain-containing protein [Planctomycetia bacterium]